APALDVVEHEVQVFYQDTGGLDDFSPFHLPSSHELDQMWSNLYSNGISRITREEAARLPNKTHAIPGDDGHYASSLLCSRQNIAELDVFHSLHCLNKIRMAVCSLYEVMVHPKPTLHCVDHIRQSIMCHGDTSVLVWQWDDSFNRSGIQGNIARTCRQFDKLQDWA
ncbi:hypothetical protein FB451DRAFT_995635, partial [Mycena latifolia]